MFWSPLQRRENGPIAFHAPRLIRHRMPWVGSRGCERFDEKDHPHFQWFKARSATKPDPDLVDRAPFSRSGGVPNANLSARMRFPYDIVDASYEARNKLTV